MLLFHRILINTLPLFSYMMIDVSLFTGEAQKIRMDSSGSAAGR